MKRYLLFVTLPYSYSILRPLQAEILRQGGEVAWFIEEECPNELTADEYQLKSVAEVMQFRPIACFAPGNYIPHFFPGVKVHLGHGYPINKRNYKEDTHFKMRGWFDMHCTQGPSSTSGFERQAARYGFFRVYETGWCKADTYFAPAMQQLPQNARPTILYSTTFTQAVTSAALLADTIEELVQRNEWDWIFMFHPKMDDPAVLERYGRIARENPNATFLGNTFSFEALQRADVMLCDRSSIMLEFMFLDKPVVAFRNTPTDVHLIHIAEPEEVEQGIRRAIERPEEVMERIRAYTLYHEPHRDCQCSKRVLAAVDHFIAEGHKGLKRKPLNWVRKIQMRRKFGYWRW